MTGSVEPGGSRTNRRILEAAVLIGLMTVVIRLLGLVKNQTIALRFGVGIDVEAFLVASMIPTYAFGVLASTFPSALIPTYARLRAREGPGAVRSLVSNVVSWSVIVLLAACVASALLWFPFLGLIGRDFPPVKQELCTRLFYLLLPSLVLHGVASVWAAALNAEKRFLLAVVAPGAIPVVTTLSVFLLAGGWGAYALVAGHVVGVVIEFLLLGLAARSLGQSMGFVRPRRSPALDQVLAQYIPVFGGGLLMQSTTVVDQGMAAALLPAGNLAALTYANVIISAVLGVAGMSLGTAILPFLADMAQAGDCHGIRTCLRFYARLILLASVPFVAAVLVFRSGLVSLFYERGAFVEEDTRVVSGVMAMYALQIPFFAIGILCARVVSALHANAILLRVSALNLVVNLGFNLLLIPSMGAAGIALSTAIVYLTSTAVMWWWIDRRLSRAMQ